MSKIKVVLWDIDGTLLNFAAAEKAAIRKCFETHGLGECTDSMLAEYVEINHKYWKMLERGELTKPEVLVGRFQEFFEGQGLDVSVAPSFNEEYQVRLGDTVCFEEKGLEVIKHLKGKVLQCAVTNGTKVAQKRKLANSGLDQLLDHIFISDEIGIEKPMIGFFEAVWDKIGRFSKEEVLIVGDSLTSDMQGGVNAQILTCWYNPQKAANTSGLSLDYEIHYLEQVLDILNM
jgi:YjjG family noncanonical pyrimidine nucleotidase